MCCANCLWAWARSPPVEPAPSHGPSPRRHARRRLPGAGIDARRPARRRAGRAHPGLRRARRHDPVRRRLALSRLPAGAVGRSAGGARLGPGARAGAVPGDARRGVRGVHVLPFRASRNGRARHHGRADPTRTAGSTRLRAMVCARSVSQLRVRRVRRAAGRGRRLSTTVVPSTECSNAMRSSGCAASSGRRASSAPPRCSRSTASQADAGAAGIASVASRQHAAAPAAARRGHVT